MSELEDWKMSAEDWRRRWLAITEKFNLNADANRKLREELGMAKKYLSKGQIREIATRMETGE